MRIGSVSLALALQGGGAHGAFTWGVLDGLLEAQAFDLVAASGASAGAMNAVVLAHGLMVGGPDGARRGLAAFWQAVARSLPADPVSLVADGPAGPGVQVEPWFRAMLWWGRLLPPGALPAAGPDPLAAILQRDIDFAGLRRWSPLRLFIATTHARSARLRLFREHELSADVLLASACLPQWRRTVWVEGEPYWDGGYSANPPLQALAAEGGARDLLLVLLLPSRRQALPTSAREIESRVQELGFVTPFLAELRGVMQAGVRPWWWLGLARRPRWHAIDASAALGGLPTETRLAPSERFLGVLRDLGRSRAFDWLQVQGRDVGRRSSMAPIDAE
jgi:NTE family protein